jgi:DHA3 family macrolide efflux protein-like MFS transporter
MLAVMMSVGGICTVLGGVLLSVWGGSGRRVITVVCGVAVSGMVTVIIGIAPLLVGAEPSNQYMLTLVMVSAELFLLPIVNGCLGAVFQATVPVDMQGRVFSLISSGAAAITPIGYAVAGPMADAFGVQFWFTVAGSVTTAAGLACTLMPSVMGIEQTAMRPQMTATGPVDSMDAGMVDADGETHSPE